MKLLEVQNDKASGRTKNRLTKLYPKPMEGEEIPVSFLGAEKKKIGWSPEDKKSVYIEEDTDTDSLKRVRDVYLVQVFNWLSGREGLIELSDPGMESLRNILETKNGDQLVYTRAKVKDKLVPRFSLREPEEPRKWLVSDRL
ncbi:MAG: hypothetical protein ACXQT4_07295 [Methanotrichaceae archaeon]